MDNRLSRWFAGRGALDAAVAGGAGVAHRASATHNETNPTTSATITIPASVAADDLLFLSTSSGGTNNPSVSDDDSGGNAWAEIAAGTGDDGTLWWKRATSATASKTVTVTDASATRLATGMAAYSGGSAGSPPYVGLSTENNAIGNETHAEITPDVANCMICFVVVNDSANHIAATFACTDPGAMTQRYSANSAPASSCRTQHVDALQSGGPTATGAFTWSQTNDDTISFAWAIKPA